MCSLKMRRTAFTWSATDVSRQRAFAFTSTGGAQRIPLTITESSFTTKRIARVRMRRLKALSISIVTVGVVVLTNVPMRAAEPAHSVIRIDPALDQIVAANARFEMLKADYFGISEGPVWIQQGRAGYLLFSDIGANVIYKWTPDGMLSVFLDKSGYTGELAAAGFQGVMGI